MFIIFVAWHFFVLKMNVKTQILLVKMCRATARRLYLQHCKKFSDDSTPNHEKFIKTQKIDLKSKRAKNSYGGYPMKFAGSTKNPIKKYWNTKSKVFPKKKVMGNTLKLKRIQSSMMWLPDETHPGSLKNNRIQVKFKTT
jgi:ribosomal protein S17E